MSITEINIQEFNKMAEKYDKENPICNILAQLNRKEIIKHNLLKKEYECLDFGVGTGNFTFNIIDMVKSVNGIDSSDGMLKVFNERIKEFKMEDKITSECLVLENKDQIKKDYDCILSQLVFHHIGDVNKLLSCLIPHLKSKGILIISDFNIEGNEFFKKHASKAVSNHGIDINEMFKLMKDHDIEPCEPIKFVAEVEVKKDEKTEIIPFQMLLLYGYKN